MEDNKPRHAKTFKEVIDEEQKKEKKEIIWKPFKEDLRLHRLGKTRATTIAEDGAGQYARPDSPLAWNTSMRFGKQDDEKEETVAEEKQVKTSLMSLLADSGGFSEDDDENEEDGYKRDMMISGGLSEEGNEGEMMHDCCKFMVQQKDAAFISCGHTFCRICSRERWAGHENCPVCHGFIMEILDIF